MSEVPKITVVVGPTASGKTALGVALAQRDGGGVVSADSRQLYSGMTIGTASPLTVGDRRPHDIVVPDVVDEVDHYLLNVRRPDNEMSLADWQAAAFTVIDHLHEKNVHPLLVGGTMLYVDSVVKNYAIPAVEPDTALRARLESQPTDELYEQLVSQDPAAATFIDRANKRRVVRALEVIAMTGKPFSTLRGERVPRYGVSLLGIFPGWPKIERDVTRRVQQMMRDGLLTETELLIGQYGSTLPLLQTINYKQAVQVLAGELSREEATLEMIRANLRYARRQMSWWRGRDEIRWSEDLETALKVYKELYNFNERGEGSPPS